MIFNKTILLIILLVIFGCTTRQKLPTATIKDITFELEIADTQELRKTGLMYRDQLAENKGMLFIFPQSAERNFWMKNTLIPLDIIYINNNRIVNIHKNTPPCSSEPCPQYHSNAPSNQVIEINGGLSDKYNFQIGDPVTINTNL